MSRLETYLPYFPDIGAPAAPTYPTEGLEPLSYELDPNGGGKSVFNPPRPDSKRSPHYDTLWDNNGAANSKPWFDFHIYHKVGWTIKSTSLLQPNNPNHIKYAHQLYEAVRREFPEVRTYRVSCEL